MPVLLLTRRRLLLDVSPSPSPSPSPNPDHRRPLLDAGLRGLEVHTSKLEFSVQADGGELEADIDKALDDAMR